MPGGMPGGFPGGFPGGMAGAGPDVSEPPRKFFCNVYH